MVMLSLLYWIVVWHVSLHGMVMCGMVLMHSVGPSLAVWHDSCCVVGCVCGDWSFGTPTAAQQGAV